MHIAEREMNKVLFHLFLFTLCVSTTTAHAPPWLTAQPK